MRSRRGRVEKSELEEGGMEGSRVEENETEEKITPIFHIAMTNFNSEHLPAPTTKFYHLYTTISPVTRGDFLRERAGLGNHTCPNRHERYSTHFKLCTTYLSTTSLPPSKTSVFQDRNHFYPNISLRLQHVCTKRKDDHE